ncbi:MAG: ThaI family type II restriction endonuclease [Chloroflexota bacterium]
MDGPADNRTLEAVGRDRYLKLPKRGTNPRGVEISAEAMGRLVDHTATRSIPIDWKRPAGQYDPYERWVEYSRLD